MSWLKKLLPQKTAAANTKSVPEGLWKKCPECDSIVYNSELLNNMNVCPNCDFHHRISARQRLDFFLDKENRQELAVNVVSNDPLKFRDSRRYVERIRAAEKTTQEKEALIVIKGQLQKIPVVAAAFEFDFIGGSMGSAVGERFVVGVETAISDKSAFICFTASGGARMQEGLLSLMQMAKTNAALTKLAKAKLPFICVLTDPTLGGVSASFAFVGDLVIAEPKALIGFAGPRVIANTVREELPPGFQRAEFLLAKGAIDMICHRCELPQTIAQTLLILQNQRAAG